MQQRDIDNKGEYFINSGIGNQGIKGKTSRKAKIMPSNTVTIDLFGNAFYRDFQYKMATHNHVFSLSGEIIKNPYVGLYLVAQMNYLHNIFLYSNMCTWKKIQDYTLLLPITSNGDVDFDFMERYIKAVEKVVVKDVVDWKDKELAITKNII